MFRLFRLILMALPVAASAVFISLRAHGEDGANAHLSGYERFAADIELMLDTPALAPAHDLYMALFAMSGAADGGGSTQMRAMPDLGAQSAGGAKFVTVEK